MKKILSFVFTLSIIFVFCTNSFAMSQSHASRGASSEFTFGYSDSYTSEIRLNYSGLSIGSIAISRNEIVTEDVTDQYPYLMLELKKPNEDYECYKETAKVRDRVAVFNIKRVQPGEYQLYIYHNDSAYGTFNSVIYGQIEVFIDKNEGYIINHPVYDDNLAIKDEEVLYNETFEYFLKPSEGIESNDPEIIQIAESITSSCRTPYQKALAIHDFVASNIYYNWDYINGKAEYGDQSAKTVIRSQIAVCEGYSSVLVAIARAVGIPARKIYGVSFNDFYTDSPFSQTSNHTWAELWIDGRWLITDCTWDSGNKYENSAFIRGNVSHMYFDISLESLSLQHLIRQAPVYNNLYLYIGYPKFSKNGGDWIEYDYGVSPILINDRTFIPLRAVIENMGGSVDFYRDGNYDKIHCYLNGHDIQMWINYGTYYVDGIPYYFEYPPQIVNDRTMVPLRSIFEQAGCAVTYDEFADNWHGRVTIGYVG